jgi:hypothetical protein
VRHIDYSGDPVAVDPANVVSKASAEDWLLFFRNERMREGS